MRRKIEKEEGFTDGEVMESWSGKRILVGLFVLVIIIGASVMFLSKVQERTSKVLGSKTQLQQIASDKDIKLPSKETAQDLLNTAKKELDKITSENVSASDGALQKVISDLQKVQNGKETPIDALCKMVCKQ